MEKLLVIILIMILCLFMINSCVKSNNDISILYSPVNQQQALERAKLLSDHLASSDIKFYRMSNSKELQQYSSCYIFQVQLAITYENKPMYGYIWVEADTGRIIRYNTASPYMLIKNDNKDKILESDLISKQDAFKIAEKIVYAFNIDMKNMKMIQKGTKIKFGGNSNTYLYIYSWNKFVDINDINSVKTPECFAIQIDAESGELVDYIYKYQKFNTNVISPLISKEYAIDKALKICKPTGNYKTEAYLSIYNGEYPKYDKNILVWHIIFIEERSISDRMLEAKIDAQTGEDLLGMVYCH